MFYKYDIHVHTDEGSPCGKTPAREIAKAYAKFGCNGIVITDHFYKTYIQGFESYEAAVDNQYNAYLLAKEEGEKLGLDVFFGIEFRYDVYDFLVLGIDKEFLLANTDIFEIEMKEFKRRVNEAGGIVIQAHPFRHLKGHSVRVFVPDVDAIETHNGSHDDVSSPYPAFYNEIARHFAKEMGIIGTAGSDTHNLSSEGLPFRKACMLFEEKIDALPKMIELITNNKFSICTY